MIDKDKLTEEFQKACSVGFIEYTGITISGVGEGYAEGMIEIKSHHLNPAGALHGGLVFSLMDTIGGFATKTLDVLPTTMSSTINYLRPTLGTKTLTAKATVLKRGKNVTVVRIDLINDQGVMVACGEANYCDLSRRVKDQSIKNLKTVR